MDRHLFYLQNITIMMILTFFLILVLKGLSNFFDLVDYPGGRKNHFDPTSLIGGIAIYAGLCLSLFFLPVPRALFFDMIAGSFLLIFIGILDDRFEIYPWFRLIVQIAAILCLILIGHHGISYIGSIFFLTDVHLGYLSILLTIILGVGFINAINMLDGQDGLAGSVIFTQVILLFLVSLYLRQSPMALILLTFLGLITVFLYFNAPLPWRRNASVFLGDSGSNFLGFFVAWAVICLSQIESEVIKPITLIWIVAFPFFDLTSVCLMREYQGRAWTNPGRDHIHHLLQRKQISIGWSTIFLSGLSLSFGILGLFLAFFNIYEGTQSILFLLLLVAYVLITIVLNVKEDRSLVSTMAPSLPGS